MRAIDRKLKSIYTLADRHVNPKPPSSSSRLDKLEDFILFTQITQAEAFKFFVEMTRSHFKTLYNGLNLR